MGRADITRQKILAAAEVAFAEKGLYGARIDEIAQSADANKRMIYAYFGSKELLYIAVLEEVYRRMAVQEKELLDRPMGCEEAVRAIIGHYFRFLRDNPTFVKMVLWENLNEATYFRQSQAQFIKGTVLELLREKLKQGVREGIFFAGLDVDETVLSVNMFCFSYFSNKYTMAQSMKVDFQDPMVFQKRCDHVTDLLMTYLLQEKGTISQ